MKSICMIILLVGMSLTTSAQFGETQAKGAYSLALAGADVNATNVYSLFSNQAGLSQSESFEVMVTGVQLNSIVELSDLSLGIVIPTRSYGTFGIGVSNFGFAEFNEQIIGLGYGRQLGGFLAIGAKLNLVSTGIQSFGRTNYGTVEIGIQSQVVDQVMFGFHIQSPVAVTVVNNQVTPTKLSAGLSYLPTDKLSVTVEGSKYIDGDFTASLGIDYRIVDILSLRVGAATLPGTFSAGLALHLRNLYRVELGFSFHEVLGLTPGISVVYSRDSISDSRSKTRTRK